MKGTVITMKADMRDRTCCFIGHTKLDGRDVERVRRSLDEKIAELVSEGVKYFGAGGGCFAYDMLAASAVLKRRSIDPDVKLILVMPGADYNSARTMEFAKKAEELASSADKVRYINDYYSVGSIIRCEKHLINNSGFCIFNPPSDRTPTPGSIRYAYQSGLRMIRI